MVSEFQQLRLAHHAFELEVESFGPSNPAGEPRYTCAYRGSEGSVAGCNGYQLLTVYAKARSGTHLGQLSLLGRRAHPSLTLIVPL